MIGQLEKSPQLEIFKVPLSHIIREDHELVRLARRINWGTIITQLSIHYSPDKGRKSIPVRTMSGMLILKHLYEGTDESIMNQWLEDPAFQYFCGEVYQQAELPFSRYELVKFRRRIGKTGLGVIFSTEVLALIKEFYDEKDKKINTRKPEFHLFRFFRQFLPGNGHHTI